MISVPHFVGGLGKLVPTVVGSDEGPATGTWCNPLSFRVNFCAYNYLRTTGVQLRAQNHTSLDGKTTSGRSFSVSGRSKMASGADMEVRQLV